MAVLQMLQQTQSEKMNWPKRENERVGSSDLSLYLGYWSGLFLKQSSPELHRCLSRTYHPTAELGTSWRNDRLADVGAMAIANV